MVLNTWIRKAKARLPRNKPVDDGFLRGVAEFRTEVTRERIRCDRNHSHFAILAIALPRDRSTHRDYLFLSKLLRRRLRVTDTAGFLADGRIAVLLPETQQAGAWKVASDVCDQYPVGKQRPDCEVYVYPDDSQTSGEKRESAKQPVVIGASSSLDSLFALPTPFVKRVVDVAGATIGLCLASPMLLVFGLLIKATSPGPVLFAQLREGRGGRRFRMYKLRSMRVDAELLQASLRAHSEQDGPAFKMTNDPRTTWIGRLLRKTSLDELPQLWNVLVGDMSLVGPRPLPVAESQQCAGWQRRRLSVLPGLTCVWQVRGRSTVSFEDWMRMDLEYLRYSSFAYDVGLMLKTIPTLLLPRGPR
jgi:lipopolysaccharide/colanic/teichoic acid biosynthesis glycosyltransferase